MADVTTDQSPPSPTESTTTDPGCVTPPNRPWCPEYSMNHTPIVKKAQRHSKFSAELPEIRERQREIAAETRGHFIYGPSATAFLNKYMPWNDATPKDYRKKQPSRARKDILASMTHVRESAMYEKYVRRSITFCSSPADYFMLRSKLLLTGPCLSKRINQTTCRRTPGLASSVTQTQIVGISQSISECTTRTISQRGAPPITRSWRRRQS